VCKERLSTVDALVRNPSGRRTIIRNDVTSGSVRTTQGGAAVVRPARIASKPTTRRSAKGRIKSSTVAVYAGVFSLLVAVIALGYRAPQQEIAVSAASPITDTTQGSGPKLAINEVVASDVAASVAQTAALAIAPNVAERAISSRVEATYATASSSSVAKPAIVAVTNTASRHVEKYTVLDGDTVDSVAAKFNISTNTVKWANDLTGNSLVVGAELEILPRDGVLYTVKDGDTIEKIAEKYKSEAALITAYNDLELNGVTAGLRIVVPGGELPEAERPGYVAPRLVSNSGGGTVSGSLGYGWGGRAGSVGNRYAFGNCTFYAYERRAALGRPVGSFWGNAKTWAGFAQAQGYAVNRTPAAGAVLVDTQGYYGHVAVVERVLANGDVVISEMNNYAYGGFNIVNNRTLTPGQAALYQYVH